MTEILEKLTSKDEMSAYEYCKQLVVESAVSNKYFCMIDDFASLHEVVLYRPEMHAQITSAIKGIDLSKYKDSMSPLIKKDADELLKIIGE